MTVSRGVVIIALSAVFVAANSLILAAPIRFVNIAANILESQALL